MPTDSPSGQKNADDRCKVGNGELAKIGRYNVTNALDIIGNKIPHWARLVTSDGNVFFFISFSKTFRTKQVCFVE